MNITIYVQSTYGVGHAVMMFRAAEALAKDHNITILYGGQNINFPICKNISLIILPPLLDSENRETLVSPDSRNISEVFKDREILIKQHLSCDCFIFEHYPFGRTNFDSEISLLTNHAQNRDVPVVCSVRDILGKSYSVADSTHINTIIRKHISHILIHGDPQIYNLPTMHPSLFKNTKSTFTGYLSPDIPTATKEPDGYLIHGGGGRGSLTFFEKASQLIKNHPDQHFYISPGQAEYSQLFQHPNCTILPWDPFIYQTLRQRKGLISMAGYNSAVEALSSQIPSILVSHPQSIEQEIRAKCFRSPPLNDSLPNQPLNINPDLNGLQFIQNFFSSNLL